MVAMVEVLVLLFRRQDAGGDAVGEPVDDAGFLAVAMVKALDAGDAGCSVVGCRVGGLDQLAHYAGVASVDALGPQLAVLDGVEAVEVEGLAVLAPLQDPLALVVVEEVGRLAAVVDLLDPVLFVPEDGPFLAAGLAGPAGHVAVGIVAVELVPGVGDRMRVGAAVPVVEDVVGLLRQMLRHGRLEDLLDLVFPGEVANGVVDEFVAVQVLLAGAEGVFAVGRFQLVQVVVLEDLGYRTRRESGVCGSADGILHL